MAMITEREHAELWETREIKVQEDDLIQELGQRLGCLWGYDRHIANSDGRPDLQEFWINKKSQEQRNIDQLKKRIQQDN